jgi:nucleotide-binding universal stress UspA family protein
VAVGLGDAGKGLNRVTDALFGDAIAVHLVHVREPELPRHERVLRQEEEAEDRAVERAFDRAREGWRLPGDVSTVTRVLVGRPAEELRKFAESAGADLLVVGVAASAHLPHAPHRCLAPWLYHLWRQALLLVPIGDAE